jgi:2-polyprenyl-6-methoxyphenol hydroxylase-like FAD-dependent oxidoreductase
MAMAGAYVLAGEIAAAGPDPAAGITRYEDEIREYVLRNQAAARRLNEQDDQGGPGDFTDFGTMVEDLSLKNYPTPAPPGLKE